GSRRKDRRHRSGSHRAFAHRAAEVLDEGRQGALHGPPSRDAGTSGRARAVAGGRFSPPSERSRRKAQRPRGQRASGGTGKANLRSGVAAASPNPAAVAEVTQHMLAAQQRQAQEKLAQFTEFAKRQDDLFKEKAPDMADEAKAAELQKQALAVLGELGFTEAELRPCGTVTTSFRSPITRF